MVATAMTEHSYWLRLQPIGMLCHSSGNHDWLLANAIACVSCGFHLCNARNASDCVWMETGLKDVIKKSMQRFETIAQLRTLSRTTPLQGACPRYCPACPKFQPTPFPL